MSSSVKVIISGYAHQDSEENWKAKGTVVFIRSSDRTTFIVDTGSPFDRDELLVSLKKINISVESVDYVICTHSHGDHIGNLNLFQNSKFIICGEEFTSPDKYSTLAFTDSVYKILDDIEIWKTPGHSFNDISVVVHNGALVGYGTGQIICCGDLFDSVNDSKIWKSISSDPDVQMFHRGRILELSAWIIPGHGKPFRNTDHEDLI